MKFIVNISRILVGALFIFSGFIKLNDPLGFSYKLQEYFSYDVLDLPVLMPYALGISIFVVVFEVVLGVFLLIGYKPKFTVWSLLGMIVFFTFLTFYAAYFEKVKDCGCFGDFLKLTPWESFSKDLILLFLILILFVGQKHIKPILSKLGLTITAMLSFIVCLWFGYHVLMHLPTFDFRAYKIGDNFQENMKLPADAKDAIIDYHWTYTLDGKEQVITDRGRGPKTYDKIIGVETETIQEGDVPKIQDFSIESEDEDVTQQFLETEKLVMIVSYNLDKAESDGMIKLKAMADEAIKNGYTVIGLTASGADKKLEIQKTYNLDVEFYLCDEKVLKTIVRANPGVVVLEKGTVTQKVHWNDIDELEF
ncbi:BT_3928 family protein [Psychroserpens ponticola]|uniref:DoxX family membrane protein n=1 Tax=Psychroserpens ponticola TaxID=2932268 RepID=A0ABY7S0B6_9FLAO|nr:BT_3928 family protein [Psychroserpens ponticola]WCO02447.1 DoxX family membrane protein [Psychroserpens ponticola]